MSHYILFIYILQNKVVEEKNAELHNVLSHVEAQLNNFYNFCVN